MTFSQVIIFGAGAIGSAYGAFLSDKNPVTLIGRPIHMKAVHDNGLTIVGDRAGVYTVATATKIKKIPKKALVIVCMKAYDLFESLQTIQPLVRSDTVLLLLQNGLGIEEIAQKALNGQGRVLRGIVTMGAEVLEPGCVLVRQNPTLFNVDKLSKEVVQTFQSSGLTTKLEGSFYTELWQKVTTNCVVNPLSAILQVPTYELASPHLTEIRHRIVEECISVGTAEGAKLESSLIQKIDHVLPNYNNLSSMLQDIQRGNPTEIEFLNGKVVEFGKKHNVPTLVNECLVNLVRFMESYRK